MVFLGFRDSRNPDHLNDIFHRIGMNSLRRWRETQQESSQNDNKEQLKKDEIPQSQQKQQKKKPQKKRKRTRRRYGKHKRKYQNQAQPLVEDEQESVSCMICWADISHKSLLQCKNESFSYSDQDKMENICDSCYAKQVSGYGAIIDQHNDMKNNDDEVVHKTKNDTQGMLPYITSYGIIKTMCLLCIIYRI